MRWFCERSKDSNARMLPKDDGISPVKPLPDKLRTYSDFNCPISSGIDPLKLLKEKSIKVKIVRIFSISNSKPLMIVVIVFL